MSTYGFFSLGYRFLTDVVRIRFDNYVIEDWEHGLSILYGFLRGACSYLNIEENDISGCLQYEPVDGRPTIRLSFLTTHLVAQVTPRDLIMKMRFTAF